MTARNPKLNTPAKRVFDLVVAWTALIVLSPVLVVVALAILLVDGRPILFTQPRPGLDGASFVLMKFRTMRTPRHAADADDGPRITPLGKFLRASSLDELPELWNVIRGDMSIVGPRPLLEQYLPLYSREQARRHAVRPGLTGLAQVKGRNSLSWDEKLALDVRYVDSRSFLGDLAICLETVAMVLSRRGVSADGHATMPAFKGSASAEAGEDIPSAGSR